jgi:hypothetical protein
VKTESGQRVGTAAKREIERRFAQALLKRYETERLLWQSKAHQLCRDPERIAAWAEKHGEPETAENRYDGYRVKLSDGAVACLRFSLAQQLADEEAGEPSLWKMLTEIAQDKKP